MVKKQENRKKLCIDINEMDTLGMKKTYYNPTFLYSLT